MKYLTMAIYSHKLQSKWIWIELKKKKKKINSKSYKNVTKLGWRVFLREFFSWGQFFGGWGFTGTFFLGQFFPNSTNKDHRWRCLGRSVRLCLSFPKWWFHLLRDGCQMFLTSVKFMRRIYWSSRKLKVR